MTSILLDIKDGLSSSTAIKGPCKVASTANLALSGTQTIDGIAVVVDDRVLVKDQTTASENGIYVVDTGPWRRAKDFNRTKDVKTGTLVCVTSGSTGQGLWQVTTPDPIVVGTTSIIFTEKLLEALPSGVGLYDSKTALAAATVIASVNVIQVAGNAAAGDDNDGEAITLVRDAGGTLPGYLLDTAGTHFANLSRTIKFSKMFHGANTGGAVNNSAALIAAIDEIIAKGGGEIIVPAGQYLFTTGLANKLVTCNLVITWHPDAVFVADTGFTVPLLYFRGAAGTTRLNKRIILNAPRIDISLGLYTGNQPSAIGVSNYEEVYVNEPWLYGGESRSGVDLGGGNFQGGDSGIEPLNISYFEVRGGKIKGFLDNGIYAGGQNDATEADDGIEFAAIGTKFEYNNNGFDTKRSGFYMKVSGCIFYNNGLGVVTAEIPLPQDGGTAQRMDVTDCLFTRNTRAAEFRAQTKGRFNNNTVEDWGYLEDLTTIVANAATRRALTLNGARNISINDNRFRMVDLATDAHIAIDVRNYTDVNAVVWTGGAAAGGNNSVVNVERPLVEAAGVTQSILGFVAQGGVAVTWTAIADSTIIKLEGIGSPNQSILVGNAGAGLSGGVATYTQRKEQFNARVTGAHFVATTALTAGSSDTATVTVTGAEVGDEVVVGRMNAAANNPDVFICGYVSATDTVTLACMNAGSTTRDLSTWSLMVDVTRI